MKKKIALLGSTGSIGKSLLKIISRDKKKVDIILLTANKNYKQLIKQTKQFKVRNVIINDELSYKKFKKLNTNKKLGIFNNFNSFNKIFKNKIDYTMSSIVGIEGLLPTVKIIKFTKKIAIANKETIICAWGIIEKELKKYKTEFLPIDSEHFSIWYGIKSQSISNIDKIFLTASGGPLLEVPKNKYNKLNVNQITKHPNWQMGKKISVDSSTMMNKVFEVIEAKKIFNLDFKNISIIIHPRSYIHAIIKFKDNMIKLIAHDTTMEIPIFNSLQYFNLKKIRPKKLNFKYLNKLNLQEVKVNKFPLVNIIKKLPKKNSLYETILVAANDEFVNLFLKKKLSYTELVIKLTKFVSKREFTKYKLIEPKKITDILKLNQYVCSKINSK